MWGFFATCGEIFQPDFSQISAIQLMNQIKKIILEPPHPQKQL